MGQKEETSGHRPTHGGQNMDATQKLSLHPLKKKQTRPTSHTLLAKENEELLSWRLFYQEQNENCPLGGWPDQRESECPGGRAAQGRTLTCRMQLPCCGYNRVKSVNVGFIEPQSKSQGPGGRW